MARAGTVPNPCLWGMSPRHIEPTSFYSSPRGSAQSCASSLHPFLSLESPCAVLSLLGRLKLRELSDLLEELGLWESKAEILSTDLSLHLITDSGPLCDSGDPQNAQVLGRKSVACGGDNIWKVQARLRVCDRKPHMGQCSWSSPR